MKRNRVLLLTSSAIVLLCSLGMVGELIRTPSTTPKSLDNVVLATSGKVFHLHGNPLSRDRVNHTQLVAVESIGGKRAQLVLFSFMYSDAPFTAPHFPFFLKSAEFSGVDVILVGDTAPRAQLPSNVLFFRLSWEDLCARLEDLLSEPAEPRFYAAGLRAARLSRGNSSLGRRDIRGAYKVADLKPFLALIMAEVVAPYRWWGWCDTDMFLGNVGGFAEKLRSDVDFVRFVPSYSLGWLSIVRNSRSNNGLVIGSRLARNAARRVLNLTRYAAFDEWGARDFGGLGFWASFSSIVRTAAKNSKVQVFDIRDKRLVLGDHSCREGAGHCATCRMDFTRGRTQLFGWNGDEKLVCHWELLKKSERMAASVSSLKLGSWLKAPVPHGVCGSFDRGFWFASRLYSRTDVCI